ncbi:MAG: TldD/PmbA family protein [Betaproteobacteria bacterium]|nr:TldD/PmbA family protein [Betaproteobacteria bacterium]
MALDRTQSTKLLQEVLATAAKVAPGAQAKVGIVSAREANARFAKGGITSAGDVNETTLTVGLAFGKRHASSTTNQLDARSLRDVVVRTREMAKLAPEDPEYMPPLGAQKYASAGAAYDPAIEKLDATALADAAQSALRAAKDASVDLAGYLQHRTEAWGLADSAGLSAYHLETPVEFTATARTPDGTGSGWGGAWTNRWRELDAGATSTVAIDKALKSRKARALAPGRYTVVLEPAAVANLISFLAWSLDARRADEGRSFFAKAGGGTKLGERLFGEHITFRSDPGRPEMPFTPFDEEGLPILPTTWIDRGQVAALEYSRYWAAKQSKTPTGRPEGYELLGGTESSAKLVSGVKRGVLITRFWYLRWLDPMTMTVTGLTRDGVFLIEGGEVTGPVNNFRFNESPINLLKNADGLASQVRVGNKRVPALRSHEFNLASVSNAV